MADALRLLRQMEEGDASAAQLLLPLVYDELRRLAAARIQQEKPGQTLTPTALVHEAYLRLVDTPEPQAFNGQAHFFGAAAQAMRRILVERAREKKAIRHGGGFQRQEMFEQELGQWETTPEVLLVHDALDQLAQCNPELARLVELKYFGGLSIEEVAGALAISERTAHRQWAYAKAWLKDAISDS